MQIKVKSNWEKEKGGTEEEVKKKNIKETNQDLCQTPLERIFKDTVSWKQNANKGHRIFLAAARWHHQVWAQYKVALYFSHHILLTREKEACWLCLDTGVANVAPELPRCNDSEVASFSQTSLTGKRKGQFCPGTLEGRVSCTKRENFFSVLLN